MVIGENTVNEQVANLTALWEAFMKNVAERFDNMDKAKSTTKVVSGEVPPNMFSNSTIGIRVELPTTNQVAIISDSSIAITVKKGEEDYDYLLDGERWTMVIHKRHKKHHMNHNTS
ncbi:hypothetical protein ACFE04_020776 [Oxalis oulophora]